MEPLHLVARSVATSAQQLGRGTTTNADPITRTLPDPCSPSTLQVSMWCESPPLAPTPFKEKHTDRWRACCAYLIKELETSIKYPKH